MTMFDGHGSLLLGYLTEIFFRVLNRGDREKVLLKFSTNRFFRARMRANEATFEVLRER